MKDQDQQINGVPHRQLDGYDGGVTPPKAFMDELLKNAPPEIQARAKEFAQQRAQAQAADKQGTVEEKQQETT